MVADEPVPFGDQVLGVTSVPAGTTGSFTVLHGERAVGRLEYEGQLPLALQHGGAGLRIGHDAGLPVTDRYAPPFPWTWRAPSGGLCHAGGSPGQYRRGGPGRPPQRLRVAVDARVARHGKGRDRRSSLGPAWENAGAAPSRP